ncbi:MAG: 2-oxo acid dehydrogenase subunit E2 [Sandaracinaceae bacterium]|nr:2-oxo acid dehydrogenase subunit E2 [Sandaracinaceae bacterium]
MTTTVTMPQLGESIVEGEVGEWLVREGDRVERDQPLVTVLTDKTDAEVPATEAGVVTRIVAATGQTVAVGAPLCEIDPNAQAGAQPKAAPPAPAAAPAPPTVRNEPPAASPSVRKLAREHDVDLGGVAGSGDGGRITHEDVRRAVSPAPAPTPREAAPAPRADKSPLGFDPGAFRVPPFSPKPGDEVVPFSRRRRIIADHMVYSKLTSPHVVTFAETDIHRTAQLRDRHKGALAREGINLTYLAFVVAATCKALREHRVMNSRVLDGEYALIKAIHIGLAVETPEGLVVPVIKNADELSVRGIARAIGELADKARDGQLTPDDLSGKTFTISNPGRKGNLVGGAIISQPNVGILRMGEIKKRVVVVEHEGVDTMAIHPVMYMALSYDHRVVDGVEANGFLFRIHELLEAGDFAI